MQERDLQAEQAFARCCVDQLDALAGEGREGCLDVVHLVRHVVHARAALGEELADGRVFAGGREQLDAVRADEHGGSLNALLGDRRTVLQLGAEKARVRVECLVEVVDGDTEVMDAACVHSGDANEGSATGEELEPVAEGIRRVEASAFRQLVVPRDLADPVCERGQLLGRGEPERRMGLARRSELVLDAEVELLRSEAEPDAAARRERLGLGDLLEPADLSEESPRLGFAPRRDRELDMVDPSITR